MTLSQENLRDILLASLPEGPLWPRSEDSQWALFFSAIAPEFVQIDQLNQQLIQEMSPATTSLLFEEWEADLGLSPDDEQTLSQRRSAMLEKFYFVDRQDKQFFIDLAASIGFEVTIDEFSADTPGPGGGLSVVRSSGEIFHVSPSGDEWNYVWRVNAPSTATYSREYSGNYGEAYTSFNANDLLENTLRQYAHEHRVLIFAYG